MTQKEFIELTENRKVTSAIEAVFKELVPESGKADTVAGEVIRALNTVFYRFINNEETFYRGQGLKTVAPSMQYLFDTIYDLISDNEDEEEYYNIKGEIEDILLSLEGFETDTSIDKESYRDMLEDLGIALIDVLSDKDKSKLFGKGSNTTDSRYVEPSYFEICFKLNEKNYDLEINIDRNFLNSLAKEDLDEYIKDSFESMIENKFGEERAGMIDINVFDNKVYLFNLNKEEYDTLSELSKSKEFWEELIGNTPQDKANLDEDFESKISDYISSRDEEAINKYKKLAHINDDFEITADNINPRALQRCSCYCNYDINDLKEMLIESCKKGE